MSKDQAISPTPIDDKQVDRISKSYGRRYDFARAIIAARDAQWKSQQPVQPDCRTCDHKFVDGWGHDICARSDCTNGDKYQLSKRLVLWAAAKGGAL